jgi:5-carboxyvanillate decarboxylase
MKMNRREFLEDSSKMVLAGLMAGGMVGAGKTAAQTKGGKRKYRLIATEEAFTIPEQADAFRRVATGAYSNPDLDMWRGFLVSDSNAPPLLRRLHDLEGERIEIMNGSGVDMHVLSLTSPGVQMFDADTATGIAATANDRLAEVIRKHPDRFSGLASFAPQDPKRAAKEIDRAINKLKLNGLIVNSHTNGEYLDDRKYWPIFEAATAAKAAIYIHPRNMPDPCAFMLDADVNLAGAIWGFQMET